MLAASGYTPSGAVVMFGLAALLSVPVFIIGHWLRTGHYDPDRIGQARGTLVFFGFMSAMGVVLGVWNLYQSLRPGQ